MKKILLFQFFLSLTLLNIYAQKQTISSVSFAESVYLFDKYEVSFQLFGEKIVNPYDPSCINVYAIFTNGDNRPIRVNAFYYEGYSINESITHNEIISRCKEEDGWRIRFSPLSLGQWSFNIFVENPQSHSKLVSPTYSFNCISPKHASGFISKSNSQFLP